MRPVAVAGLGCLCSLGPNLKACMQSLLAPAAQWTAPAPPSRFSTEHPRCYPVFELPEQVLASLPADEDLMLTARLGLAASQEALQHAGLEAPDALKGLRVGVCLGTTVGSAMNDEPFYRAYRCDAAPNMDAIRRYLRSNPAEVVARELRTRGATCAPVQTVCNACSSGAEAIGIAASWLASGLCDLTLAGGADELCRVTCNGFISLMIHSQQAVRPFDAARSGLNLGEGAAVAVLVPESDAGDHCGRVLGCGMRCDAHHLTAPHPEGRGLAQALEEAMRLAGLQTGDLAFVNAHGTGTLDNDRVEAGVLARMLPNTPFFSSKGRTGHTLGAAGAIEAALTLGCLREGRIPASAGCATPDPELPAQPVLTPQELNSEAALSFSLAFGGGNAVLALAR